MQQDLFPSLSRLRASVSVLIASRACREDGTPPMLEELAASLIDRRQPIDPRPAAVLVPTQDGVAEKCEPPIAHRVHGAYQVRKSPVSVTAKRARPNSTQRVTSG